MNSALLVYPGRDHVAVKVEGMGFNDPRRMRLISQIMAGAVSADLQSPQVIAYVYLGKKFLLAGLTRPLPVLGVEDGPSLS